MADLRPVLMITGVLLSVLAVAMSLPALADVLSGEAHWRIFAIVGAGTLFVGLTLILTCRGRSGAINLRQMILLTVISWVALAAFSAIPFLFGEFRLRPVDALFEAMSGITTTGATVLTGLDTAPPSLLLWRALLQWLGGIGIVVMAILVMPNLSIGGMQLFRLENSETSDKALPRTTQIVTRVGLVYIGLTAFCACGYWLAGMGAFDAICHSMTTLATGGYSTHDASMGYFTSPTIQWLGILFMLLGGLPFLLYLQSLHAFSGRTGWRDRFVLLKNSQVRWFLAIILLASLALLIDQAPQEEFEYNIRTILFNTISIITGTGFTTTDYGTWGSFAVLLFFMLSFVGGCAGSTCCGIKIFRFQVLYQLVRIQLIHLIRPSAVVQPDYDGRPIKNDVIVSVIGFVFVYMVVFVLLSISLGLIGLDPLTALSGAATAISNVGPGLGSIIGPAGTFADLPDAAKLLLSGAMLLGRLELSAVLVLLVPAFWRH